MQTLAGTRGDGLRLETGGNEIFSLRAVGAISGVVPLSAGGRNGTGAGRLQSSGDGTLIAWQAPGSSTFGTPVQCYDGGSFVLEDGEDPSCWLRVRVYGAFLTAGPAESRVYLDDRFNELGPDDVSAANAAAGIIETVQVQLVNHSGAAIRNMKLWLTLPVFLVTPSGGNPVVTPTGANPVAIGGIDSRITTALSVSSDGATFYQPVSESDAHVLQWATIAAGGSANLWIRRSIGAGATSAAEILNLLQYGWDGL